MIGIIRPKSRICKGRKAASIRPSACICLIPGRIFDSFAIHKKFSCRKLTAGRKSGSLQNAPGKQWFSRACLCGSAG